jgi:hypothetical protein
LRLKTHKFVGIAIDLHSPDLGESVECHPALRSGVGQVDGGGESFFHSLVHGLAEGRVERASAASLSIDAKNTIGAF